MMFEKYITHFKEYLIIKNYAENTISNYLGDSKKFLLFTETHYPRVDQIAQVSKNIVLDYQVFLTYYTDKRGRLLKNKSIIARIVAVRRFFEFLYKYDYIIVNPAICMEYPREEKVLPRNILSEQEMIDILSIPNIHRPDGKRDRAIIELLFSTGMRTSELCDLLISDIDFTEETVLIRKGKGNKMRLVPLGQYASVYVQEYLKDGRKYLLRGKQSDEGYLFINSIGNKYNRKTINSCVIRKIMQKSNIDKHISCYSIRHSTATALIRNKVDIRYVSELLGHVSLKTTQKYTHVEISDLKEMHAKYHPRG